jgi:hypothetical protein
LQQRLPLLAPRKLVTLRRVLLEKLEWPEGHRRSGPVEVGKVQLISA